MTVLLVAVGAAVGAPLRYLIDRAVQARHDMLFPWGTFAVNVIGSFVLGLIIASASVVGPVFGDLVAVGFCGALTTYSTFSYETLRLLENRARLVALANLAGSTAAGLGVAAAGYALGKALI